ncbi:MAG: hypothetical protein IKQ41_01315 [Clostridia bacterium]|nr:hypothetical protein [Clostridia bacterium]
MIKHPILVSFAVVGICIFLAAVILGLSGALNSFFFQVRKIDDTTNYNTIKQVEDSCRAMISSYTADKLAWEQYKNSDSEEQVSWANQAKMRANKTAASYNEYILKNSFIWQDNIPKDILQRLEYLK